MEELLSLKTKVEKNIKIIQENIRSKIQILSTQDSRSPETLNKQTELQAELNQLKTVRREIINTFNGLQPPVNAEQIKKVYTELLPREKIYREKVKSLNGEINSAKRMLVEEIQKNKTVFSLQDKSPKNHFLQMKESKKIPEKGNKSKPKPPK